ncbi:MAG: hypothetical protein LBL95_03570, partial [Deltaproteobacteria bacterium]|nr:hypothetical protein [Deltaproteobacteria bacterium]
MTCPAGPAPGPPGDAIGGDDPASAAPGKAGDGRLRDPFRDPVAPWPPGGEGEGSGRIGGTGGNGSVGAASGDPGEGPGPAEPDEYFADGPGQGSPGLEKMGAKPFQLAKYFSSIGVIVIFFTCLVLAAMMSDRAERIIYDRVVEDTVMIMDNVNFQMFTNFLLPIYKERGEAKLSQPEPYRYLHSVIQNAIHGFDISKVALYDAKVGMMVYSSESTVPVVTYRVSAGTGQPEAVGRLAEPMGLYSEAVRIFMAKGTGGAGGQAPSFQQPPGSPGRAAYIDYLKERTVIVRQEGGYLFGKFFPRGQFTIRCLKAMEDYYTHNISGVLELNRDLTAEYRQIASMHFTAVVVAVASSLFLSVILWMVVARGESIINQKNAEKAALDERLHQAERLANLGRMVGTVSHEIRNPLGIIRSSADFLASRLKDSPGQERLAAAIVDESGRLWRILTDFLDFARPMRPVLSPVVAEDILEEILVLLEADMSRAGVELLSRMQPDPGPILADRDQLHRAFMNLLVNAIQAMPEGGLLTVGTGVQMAGEPQGRLI